MFLRPGFAYTFHPTPILSPRPTSGLPIVWITIPRTATNFSIRPIGRLRDGVSLHSAEGAAEGVAAQARQTFSIDQTAGYYITMEPMQQHLVTEVRPALMALMGSAVFLLLIACANVANLLLVRSSLREQEFSVRAAMGANRFRLITPILAEAVLLAAMGTVAGLGLAWAGIVELRVLAPANLPRLEDIHIDGFVLAYNVAAGAGRCCHLRDSAGAARLAAFAHERIARNKPDNRDLAAEHFCATW